MNNDVIVIVNINTIINKHYNYSYITKLLVLFAAIIMIIIICYGVKKANGLIDFNEINWNFYYIFS